MPGVLPPNSEHFFAQLGDIATRLRALETQQQGGYTNGLGQLIITTGLVPGSDPPEWGFQLLDPTTGQRVALFGEDASGNVQLNITGEQTVTGTLTVTGNMVVGGTLSLPNGIIKDPALEHPAAATAWKGELHAITLPQSLTYYLSKTITPPSAQYTTAVVTLIGNGMAALSGTVSSGALYLTPSVVNGSQNINLGYLPEQSASAAYATASLSVTVSGVLTGVPSSGFQVSLGAEVSGGFAASSGNLALSATVVWLP